MMDDYKNQEPTGSDIDNTSLCDPFRGTDTNVMDDDNNWESTGSDVDNTSLCDTTRDTDTNMMDDNTWELTGRDVDNTSLRDSSRDTNMMDDDNNWELTASDGDKASLYNPFRGTGVAEFEILNHRRTADVCWARCPKYTNHQAFIPAREFHDKHLPMDYRNTIVCECVNLMSELTVRLETVPDKSCMVSSLAESRVCSGFFSYFGIREWASMFDRNVIWKQRSVLDDTQRANSGEFSESVDEFDVDRIQERVLAEMSSQEMREFAGSLSSECLRHLCLLSWPAAECYLSESEFRFQLFIKIIIFYIKQCFDKGDPSGDDVTTCPENEIEKMAICVALHKDTGNSFGESVCTLDSATTNISADVTTSSSIFSMSADKTSTSADKTSTSADETGTSADKTTSTVIDPTTKISDSPTTKISDSPTTKISDSPTTKISDSPTTSRNNSNTEEDLTCVFPCPCPDCLHAPYPQPTGYVFHVLTDRRAIVDEKAAANTIVDVVFGNEIKHLFGQTVERVSAHCDIQRLQCVTHEEKLANWIKDKTVSFERIYTLVKRIKVAQPTAIICSYPHGHAKMVSVGEWYARFSHPCGQTPPLAYVSYEYTTPTCRGCIGAPVLILGQRENYGKICSEILPHYGNMCRMENKSAIGLAVRFHGD